MSRNTIPPWNGDGSSAHYIRIQARFPMTHNDSRSSYLRRMLLITLSWADRTPQRLMRALTLDQCIQRVIPLFPVAPPLITGITSLHKHLIECRIPTKTETGIRSSDAYLPSIPYYYWRDASYSILDVSSQFYTYQRDRGGRLRSIIMVGPTFTNSDPLHSIVCNLKLESMISQLGL